MERYLGENIPKLGFGLMRLPRKLLGMDTDQICMQDGGSVSGSRLQLF